LEKQAPALLQVVFRGRLGIHLAVSRLQGDKNHPEEIRFDETLLEGATRQVTVNEYERNEKARGKCIEKYGYQCCVCEFDFEKKYGVVGRKFIHVHHLVELSTIGREYRIDPIRDLRPVCPNCHAMLHTQKPAYRIEELRDRLTIRPGP
jgi:5-methylcytosine-specific restriction protein A